ncbi:hypothetical protein EK0264_15115 [Epidermidibacterium keratini]|uniref:Uncharacterized protein n=1 Tax=Epidermidibacterium keratini TaxID=1891644 RepID=A0A7L4YR05_9ACTN|nr:hypothetical protein [Epidermidibacterium keratini]QHC01488.1 hypothetical protein EK0264_15115 [Epidermidibacterium keratini]
MHTHVTTRKTAKYAVPLAAVVLVLSGCLNNEDVTKAEPASSESQEQQQSSESSPDDDSNQQPDESAGYTGPEPLTGQLDCETDDLADTVISMDAVVTCDGWTVQLTDFQAEATIPPDLELTDTNLDPVDPETPVASATIVVTTAGDGNPDGYSDIAYILIQGDPKSYTSSVSHSFREDFAGPGTSQTQCLRLAKVPCTGTVYFPLEDGMDLSTGPVIVGLHSPLSAGSMGSVLVVP